MEKKIPLEYPSPPPPYHEIAMPQLQPTFVHVEFEEQFPRRETCISKYFKCCG